MPSPSAASMTRRRLVGLGILAGSLTALAACSAPAASPTAAPAQQPAAKPTAAAPAGATPAPAAKASPVPAKPRQLATDLKLGFTSLNTTMDPHGTLSNSGFMTVRQMYDALVSFDDKGEKIVPQLAAEWKRIDPLTMEFKLRDDVKFSNGEAFDAEAVKFNLQRLQTSTNPLHADTKARIGVIAEAEAVNSTTVRLKTKSPDPLLLNRLAMFFMVAPKYTADGGDLNTKPIGTGSYKGVEFVPSQRMRFEAWDQTWRGKPTIQTVTFQGVPEQATLLAALRTGQVDVIFQPPADQLESLKRDGFEIKAVNSGSCTICSLIPAHPVMKDKRMREAINLAVNKEEILQIVQAGYGRVSQGQFLQPGFFGFREDLKAIPYDPERAKALVREAGYNGQEVGIMTTPSTKPFVDAVVGYLNAVGIRARTEPVELALIVQALNVNTDRPSVAFNTDYFHIRDFDAAGARFTKDWAIPHFDNEEVTQLFRAQKTEIDEKKRAEMIGKIAEIMRNEFAALFLIHREYPTAHSKKVVKIELPYDTSYRISTVEKEA